MSIKKMKGRKPVGKGRKTFKECGREIADLLILREAKAACANHTEEREFYCTHGCGHPTKAGVKAGYNIHGCDGCCSKRYKIRSDSEKGDSGRPLWWSNEDGWVVKAIATTFTAEEREDDPCNVPTGGQWVEQPRRKR